MKIIVIENQITRLETEKMLGLVGTGWEGASWEEDDYFAHMKFERTESSPQERKRYEKWRESGKKIK